MGDLAWPVAFERGAGCARRRGRCRGRIVAPRAIAGVTKAAAAPNGLRQRLPRFADRRPARARRQRYRGAGRRPAPAGREDDRRATRDTTRTRRPIGHLRNTTPRRHVVRCSSRWRAGRGQNYIDDTGVRSATSVVGFQHSRKKTLDEVRAIADSTRSTTTAGPLRRVTEWYDGDRSRLKIRSETLHAIEHGDNDTGRSRRLHRRQHRPLP